MARAIAIRKAAKMQIGELIDIDSCLEESHTMSNQVTDHPVEEGSNISDHSRPEPDRVQLRCFVSNTPFSDGQVKTAVRAGSISWETTAPEATENRGQNALLALMKMRDEGALITVVTNLKTYAVSENEGMMIESITVPVTKDNFDGLEFTMSLKAVRIVKTKTVKATDKRVRPKKKKGSTASKPAERRKSLLLRGTQAVGLVN